MDHTTEALILDRLQHISLEMEALKNQPVPRLHPDGIKALAAEIEAVARGRGEKLRPP